MAAEALHEGEERLHRNGGEDEGNAQPQRIDEQQLYARDQARLVGGERQYRRQHRPDARRPAEGESEADDVGADEADAVVVGVVIARLAIEKRDAIDADEMQAEQDDDEARDYLQLALVALDQLAEERGPGPETDEHGREAKHEQHRGEDDAFPDVARHAAFGRELVDRGAAEIAEVGRHEGQHARAQEAHETRKRHADVDLHVHEHRYAPTRLSASRWCPGQRRYSRQLASFEPFEESAAGR